jgi:hypothetical protein
MTDNKRYLGDGVYVDTDGYGGIVLSTDSGMGADNQIFIEASVWNALLKWVEDMKAKQA